jgi:hypothetical protein
MGIFWREGRMGIGRLSKMGGIFCENGRYWDEMLGSLVIGNIQ